MYIKCTMINDHECKICNKIYASRQSLWNHVNKYHNDKISQKSSASNPFGSSKCNSKSVIKDVQNNTSNYQCRYCTSIFKYKQGRWKHEQKCEIKTSHTDIIELKKELSNEIKEVRELKEQLKEKINSEKQGSTTITNTNSNNSTTNTNSNNTNNGTINNNYIIAFGKEEISKILTEKEKYKILNAKYKSLEESIKTIHFNKERPEYQNIYITNMRDNLAHVFDGEKFISQQKQETLNQLIGNHMVSIEESLETNREKLNPKTVDIIENLIEKINDEETELYDEENDKKYLNYKTYKNDLVKLFVYNESDKKKPSTSLANKKSKKKDIDL